MSSLHVIGWSEELPPEPVAARRADLRLVESPAAPQYVNGVRLHGLRHHVTDETVHEFERIWSLLADHAVDDAERQRAIRARAAWMLVNAPAPRVQPIAAPEAVHAPVPVPVPEVVHMQEPEHVVAAPRESVDEAVVAPWPYDVRAFTRDRMADAFAFLAA